MGNRRICWSREGLVIVAAVSLCLDLRQVLKGGFQRLYLATKVVFITAQVLGELSNHENSTMIALVSTESTFRLVAMWDIHVAGSFGQIMLLWLYLFMGFHHFGFSVGFKVGISLRVLFLQGLVRVVFKIGFFVAETADYASPGNTRAHDTRANRDHVWQGAGELGSKSLFGA